MKKVEGDKPPIKRIGTGPKQITWKKNGGARAAWVIATAAAKWPEAEK